MIIFDTETTDLTAPEASPISQQPHIIELAAIKLNDKTLKRKDTFTLLCRPPVPITEECTKITHIDNDMVKGAPPFVYFYPQLVDFFLGERTLVAHNLGFDSAAVKYELMRIGRLIQFPWPPVHKCTVELSLNLKGYRMKLSELHLELTGKEHKDAHRALSDTEALARVVVAMKKKGMM